MLLCAWEKLGLAARLHVDRHMASWKGTLLNAVCSVFRMKVNTLMCARKHFAHESHDCLFLLSYSSKWHGWVATGSELQRTNAHLVEGCTTVCTAENCSQWLRIMNVITRNPTRRFHWSPIGSWIVQNRPRGTRNSTAGFYWTWIRPVMAQSCYGFLGNPLHWGFSGLYSVASD